MLAIADLRKEYKLRSLSEEEVAADPFQQFIQWWDDAVAAQIEEVNAMTLATASCDGIPAARIVLLKGVTGRGFNFFSNYDSFKGQQLAENPRACLVFFWKELERQVRITGVVAQLGDADNDTYFNARPEASRISAITSPQSQVVESRNWLEARAEALKQQAGTVPLNRPKYWGGYTVQPVTIEFWQGRRSRLHDRIQYTVQNEGWKIERLAP